MASDNHASYARIGFTVFIGVAAIIATLIYLGGMGGRDSELLVETYYDKPVSGLSVGSVVNFRGVKLGEVREITFVSSRYDVEGVDNSRIYILMALNAELLCDETGKNAQEEVRRTVRMLVEERGLRATVASNGITGLSRIEFDFHKPENLTESTAISWVPKHPYIPPKASLIDNFSVAATKVMNQINRMDLESVWSNISVSVSSLARMTESGKTIMQTQQGEVGRIVDDLSTTSASLRDLAAELKRNPSLLVRERKPARLSETE